MDGTQGFSGYYDARTDEPMSGLVFEGMSGISEGDFPLLYIPDLGPVGSGASYFPRSVDDDAVALNVLGFRAGFPGGGRSQASDMANREGAWDSTFQNAVRTFQTQRGLTADGWIGPKTRTALAAAVAQFNATPRRAGQLPPPPQLPIPLPGVKPASTPVAPGAAPPPAAQLAEEDNTMRNIAIGAGVIALIGGAYFLLK